MRTGSWSGKDGGKTEEDIIYPDDIRAIPIAESVVAVDCAE